MNRSAEFRSQADRCRVLSGRASPGEATGWLRHAAECWDLLARIETDPSIEADNPTPRRWVRDGESFPRRMRLTGGDCGWALEVSGVANPLFFRSGAQAEAAARRLGARLAKAGEAASVEVYLRGGAFGGRIG